jgi:hypothetical protein
LDERKKKMDFKSYNPTKVTVMVGIHACRAFGDDTMVDAGFSNDLGEVFVSTDGEGRHVDSADRSGTVVIPLATNSPSNAVFMALMAANEPVPITVTDKSSKADLFFAGSCKLQTMPRLVKKKGNTVNEYTWKFTKGFINHSGAEV